VSENFTVEIRDKAGSNASRQLRKAGQTPAIVYGLSKGCVSVAIPTSEVQSAIRHGSQLIDLKGALNEPALIKEVQWDAFGTAVKHLDLERVDLSKDLEVTLPIVLHGVAPGVNNGGVLNQTMHEVEISCPASSLKDHLEVNINHLEIDGELFAKDIVLPAGAKLLSDPDEVVVACVVPTVHEEEETEATAEPEVIGGKPEDAEEDKD
jgi:large subunit ribosomal protein L25